MKTWHVFIFFVWKLCSRNKWLLSKQATRQWVAALWHCTGGKSSFSARLPCTGLQIFLQTFNQVCSLGTWQCWQHGTFVQQIEFLMCSPVWMLLKGFFFFWRVWRTLQADAISATQTWCFISGYLKNKRRPRHFTGLSSYDVIYINYLSF